MGYRNIKPVLVHLDRLAESCGLFSTDTDLNNGYGCKSRSKEKGDVGKCFGFDCPLAWEASLGDLEQHDEYLYKEYLEEFNNTGHEPSDIGANWMIQHRELT